MNPLTGHGKKSQQTSAVLMAKIISSLLTISKILEKQDFKKENQAASTEAGVLLQPKSKEPPSHTERRDSAHEAIHTKWEEMGEGDSGKKTA